MNYEVSVFEEQLVINGWKVGWRNNQTEGVHQVLVLAVQMVLRHHGLLQELDDVLHQVVLLLDDPQDGSVELGRLHQDVLGEPGGEASDASLASVKTWQWRKVKTGGRSELCFPHLCSTRTRSDRSQRQEFHLQCWDLHR